MPPLLKFKSPLAGKVKLPVASKVQVDDALAAMVTLPLAVAILTFEVPLLIDDVDNPES